MIFITIEMKIVSSSVCVLSLLSATGGHQASMASSQTTIFGTSGKFRWGFYGGGTDSRGSGGKKKVCESCGTVGNSDPQPHSAGTGGLHVGYQQNRRRGRDAKAIIWVWDQYVCVSVFGGWEVWNSGEAKIHHPQNTSKLQKSKA